MSPRRNRPGRSGPPGRRQRREAGHTDLDLDRVRRGVDAVETWRGEQWRVRHLAGSAADKTYRCPGCDQEVRAGVPHVVVWPVEEGLGERRHWHNGCWRARDRRGPTR